MENGVDKQIEKRYPRLWQGLVFFAAVIIAMVVICAPLQMYLGLIGVALTELIFLVMALIAAGLSRCAFSDLFPMNLPAPLRLCGILLMYFGVYLTALPVASLIAYFFPALNEVSESISELGTELTPAASVLILAVLPAICEESVHRGFILASFKSLKNRGTTGWKVLTILSMGVLFGIFHLDPLRFLPTAMLGAFFSYVAIESESMVPSMILHLINNLLSVIAIYGMSGESELEAYVSEAAADVSFVQLLGSCAAYLGLAILLFFGGWKMFKRVEVRRGVIIAVVLTACLLMFGGYAVVLLTADFSGIKESFTALEAGFLALA